MNNLFSYFICIYILASCVAKEQNQLKQDHFDTQDTSLSVEEAESTSGFTLKGRNGKSAGIKATTFHTIQNDTAAIAQQLEIVVRLSFNTLIIEESLPTDKKTNLQQMANRYGLWLWSQTQLDESGIPIGTVELYSALSMDSLKLCGLDDASPKQLRESMMGLYDSTEVHRMLKGRMSQFRPAQNKYLYAYLTQLHQANEAIRRIIQYKNEGYGVILILHLFDWARGFSQGIIHANEEFYPLYYQLKKALGDPMLHIVEANDSLSIYLYAAAEGIAQLQLSMIDFNGRERRRTSVNVQYKGGKNLLYRDARREVLKGCIWEMTTLEASLVAEENLVASASHHFVAPRALKIVNPWLRHTLRAKRRRKLCRYAKSFFVRKMGLYPL